MNRARALTLALALPLPFNVTEERNLGSRFPPQGMTRLSSHRPSRTIADPKVAAEYSHKPSMSVPRRFEAQCIRRGALAKGDKVVCLTFDDGPLPGVTEEILKKLKENEATATFFLIGRNVKAHPELAKAIAAAGHAIGSHSYTHARSLSLERARREIADTNALLATTTGVAPRLFRPPFGIKTSALSKAARERNMTLILWSISSADTMNITSREIENNILHTPCSGDIILMHDGGGADRATVKALPNILKGLKQLGFRCVTVPAMLELLDRQLIQLGKVKKTP